MLIDVVSVAVVAGLSIAGLSLFLARRPATEARWVIAGALAHALSCVGYFLAAKYYYRGGDMWRYHRVGSELADAMVREPRTVWDVALLVFQLEPAFTFYVEAGDATASMMGMSAFACLLLGHSVWGLAFLFTAAAFVGKLFLFCGFRRVFSDRYLKAVAIASFLIPSGVWWTSGIIKESVAMAGFGMLFFVLVAAAKREWSPLWLLPVGVILTGLVKPYILLVASVASGAFLVWSRSVERGRAEVRPVWVGLGLVVAVLGVVLVGRVFPRFALDNLVDETVRMQSVGFSSQEGSSYSLGDPTSGSRQYAYLPLGLLTGLYRPFLFESSNAFMLVNSLETGMFLVLTLRGVATMGVDGMRRSLVAQPILVFCVVFVILFATATGFTSSNLGALSRYRMPLVPFFALMLAVWNDPSPELGACSA